MEPRTVSPSDRVLTIPNAISFLRIALVPVFVWLIVDRDTTAAGFTLFAIVLATDWIDGVVARATGQVSDVGKVLDPLADRIAIAAGLVALIARDAFPLWAALPILVRDALVLAAGVVLLVRTKKRVEVRYVGKVATFALMAAIGAIAWGNLGYALATAFLVCGWSLYAVGVVEMLVATVLYAGDARAAIASDRPRRSC
jgi:cardiolipin synthase